MHFGGKWYPANSEPIARAKAAMTEFLFNHCWFQKQRRASKTEDSRTTTHTTPCDSLLGQSRPSPVQQGWHFTLQSPHVRRQYALTAVTDHTRNGVFRMASSSLEAGYIFYSFPDPIESPLITPSMAWDKLDALTIGPVLEAIGIIVDTDPLDVSIPIRRLSWLQEILRRHWNRNRKTFTARGAAQLIGNLLSCLQGCNWLKMLLFNFQTALSGKLCGIMPAVWPIQNASRRFS
jgi:hypothetical protein